MTERTSRFWLLLASSMIALSLIFLLIPAPTEKDGYRTGTVRKDVLSGTDLIVTGIIDGDTFLICDSVHIRLIGVDTPEKGDPVYHEAMAHAESTLLGLEVKLEYDRELYDDYGRRLVYLFIDTLFYNQEVVSRGLGTVYLFAQNRKYAPELIAAQKVARSSLSGIWSSVPVAEEYYLAGYGSFRFHRPLCLHLKKSDRSAMRRFSTRDEPLDLGLSPCRTCRP
jgi:endonuclease YncB( thermonuclease family)